MQTIVVDLQTQSKLGNLTGELMLCSPEGRLLGYFTPAVDAASYDGIDSPTSAAELRRRETESGRTLGEIFHDLESRS